MLPYVRDMRQRMGYDANDSSHDKEIEALTPMARVMLLAEWYQGDGDYAIMWRNYFASQGLYLTTNPDADGVID